MKKEPSLDPLYVFITPPSMEELESRLRKRGENEDSISKRLAIAAEELKHRDEPKFWDIVIENNDLEQAYSTLRTFVERNL